MRIAFLAALTSALLCLPAVAQDATGIENKLPEDTVFLVTTPDLKRSWGQLKQSAMWAIWQEPSVQNLYKKLRAMAEKQMDQGTGGELEKMKQTFKEKAGFEIELLHEVLLKGQFSMALTDFKVPQGPDDMPGVDLMVSMDYDPADARFAKVYDWGISWLKTQAETKGGAKVSTTKVGDVEVTEFKPEGAPPSISFCLARGAKRAYFATNMALMKRLLAQGSIEGKTLAQNPNFVNSRKGIDATKEVGHTFINLESILKKADSQIPPDAKKMMETCGAFDIKSLAASISIEGKEIVDRYYMSMPGQRRGVCKLFDYPKTAMKALRYAPADAASFSSTGFSVKALVDEALRIFKELGPQQFEEFEQGRTKMEEQLGVKLDALLAAFGTEVSTFSRLPKGTSEAAPKLDELLRATYVISLKDAATIEKALEGILKMMEVEAKVETHHGVKMRLIPMPAAADMPVKNLGIAIHDGLLFIATPGDDLKQLARDVAAGGAALSGSETFRTHLSRYPEGFSGFGYTDVAAYVRLLWKAGKPFIVEQLKGGGAPITPEDLPDFDAIAKHLTPMTQGIYSDKNGTGMIYRSPVGSLSLVAVAGIGAAVAIPAVQASQSKAKQAACTAKLKNLGVAIQAFKADNKKYPEEFGELVSGTKKYVAGPKPFVSPADPYPMKDGGIESSYIYIYANALGDKNAATTIVAYNRSPIHAGQRNVLYLDGSVKLVDDFTFRKQFDAQKAELKKHGIQVFMGWGKTK